jgi:DDE family transposase
VLTDRRQEVPRVSQSATTQLAFAPPAPLRLAVDFDGGRLTSDGGLLWVEEADRALGLCDTLAAVLPDRRRRRGRHALVDLLRQRIFQIACGYEDQDAADSLRTDPLLKLVCGRLPATGPDLASQPTFSRLENGVTATGCYRLAVALGEVYLRERERAGAPKRIVLDLDGTDDPTHGQQQGSAYHGYYRQHRYHPLLVFDGETGPLVTAILRPGAAHAGHGAKAILKHLVRAVRARWPGVAIEVRADSGFARPEVYGYCEAERLTYTIGLVPNPRLEALAAPLLAEARRRRADAGDAAKVRLVGEAPYRAASWPRDRRVVVKAELLAKGPNTRFVVTNRPDPAAAVYAWYTDRGETENWIKDLKAACFADRLSCHRFLANQVRLLLHAAAYCLLDAVRRWLVAAGAARLQLDTLRLRLIKIGGRVRQLADRVHLRLASSHPGEPLWHLLAACPHRPKGA